MVSKDQLLQGLIAYVDNEIMPTLTTKSKWIIGAATTIILAKVNNIYDLLKENQYIQAFDIITEAGLIDLDTVATALAASAQKYGKLSLNVPMVGELVFSDQDIRLIYQYVKEGVSSNGKELSGTNQ